MIKRNLREIIIFTTLLSAIGVGNILSAIGVIDPSKEFLLGKMAVFFASYIYFIYIIIRSYFIERELKQRFEDKYNAINNSNIVVVFDKNANVIEANEKFAEMMKYDMEELVGMNHSSFIYSELEAASNNVFWNKILSGESIEGEFQKKDKLGNPIWISASYSPVRCRNGIVYQKANALLNLTVKFLTKKLLLYLREKLKIIYLLSHQVTLIK